jgi:hypothetical protein
LRGPKGRGNLGSRQVGNLQSVIPWPCLLLLVVASLHAGFTKVTDGEIVNDGGWCYGCAWADYNNDSFPDLFVINNDSAQHKHNFLYRNNRDGTFARETVGPVVQDSGSSYGCAWGDYDNDGYPDLFVSNYSENNCLYHNNGNGSFTKILTGPVVNDGGRSTGAAWADYDRDGWLDLFVCNRNTVNFLYHNNGNGTFTRILTGEIATDVNNSSGCAWADYDNDSFPDLFVANVQTPNCLYHNNGDGTFTRVRPGPIATDSSFCNGASWGDFDNDGRLDLFVATGVLGMYQDLFYHNDGGGSFTKITGTAIDTPVRWSGGSGWVDFDNNGGLDLFVGGYDNTNRLYANDGTGGFAAVDTGVLVAAVNYVMGCGWADYDRDGWPDLFLARNNYFGGNNCLYHNQGGTNHWLSVHCVATVSNRSAIGARVWVKASIRGSPVRQMREISSQTGGCNSGESFSDPSFGLGDADSLDSLIVSWPSGIVQAFTGISANQFLTITEGASAVSARPALHPMPRGPALGPASPNPFSERTQIRCYSSGSGPLLIRVFDARGALVNRLVRPARTTSVVWDGKDAQGRRLNPGVYLLRLGQDRSAVLRIVKAG